MLNSFAFVKEMGNDSVGHTLIHNLIFLGFRFCQLLFLFVLLIMLACYYCNSVSVWVSYIEQSNFWRFVNGTGGGCNKLSVEDWLKFLKDLAFTAGISLSQFFSPSLLLFLVNNVYNSWYIVLQAATVVVL